MITADAVDQKVLAAYYFGCHELVLTYLLTYCMIELHYLSCCGSNNTVNRSLQNIQEHRVKRVNRVTPDSVNDRV